jgi:gluconolactonase
MHALRTDLADGYLARYEDGRFRIVADGFRFTNEIRFDAREEWLYVVETTGGCITRLRIDERGEPVEREVFGPSRLGKGAWPDGIAFDSYGNLWGTLVYSDKLFVLTPQGDFRLLLDEGEPALVDALERQFFANSVTQDVLFATGRGLAPWMASVTFGGPICARSTSARSRVRAFRISARPFPASRWSTGATGDEQAPALFRRDRPGRCGSRSIRRQGTGRSGMHEVS